ncbi:MAG TPA: CorA family divalent cation transporter, partial [Candidatus Limnocylindrales bacterium]|nr:CorA family divalent cation transporter [Candidatus Limnocylindrales bacterium]
DGAVIWADLTGATPDTVEAITTRLRLHPLIAEDIVEGNQRAKIEVTDERIHIVLFAIAFDGNEVRLDEVDVVLGSTFLLTVHASSWDPRRIHRVRDGVGDLLGRGADHLLWAVVDAIVDDYFPLMDLVGDAIDDLEDLVVSSPAPATLQRLFRLKRELLRVRRAVNPVRDVFNQLTNRDLALIDAEEILYFRDVYDHLIRLTDELDTYRELVSGSLDIYLSTVNNNLSLIMKRLTGITVILAGIGAIAGIFGMSEAGSAFSGGEAGGFWIVATASVGLALGLYFVLRRIGWI